MGVRGDSGVRRKIGHLQNFRSKGRRDRGNRGDTHRVVDAVTTSEIKTGHDKRRGPVVDRRRVAGGDGAVRTESRLQRTQRLDSRVRADRLVTIDDDREVSSP